MREAECGRGGVWEHTSLDVYANLNIAHRAIQALRSPPLPHPCLAKEQCPPPQLGTRLFKPLVLLFQVLEDALRHLSHQCTPYARSRRGPRGRQKCKALLIT